jgi:hypothetical protein
MALGRWLQRCVLILACQLVLASGLTSELTADDASQRRLLYVAEPGIRNYLEYGGHGILVFDIDDEHQFIKRIPIRGLSDDGQPSNVKGVCACAATKRIYVSTLQKMMCLDLISEDVLWEHRYEKGCDRMSISPDGKFIYLPTLEKEHWKVVDGATGNEIARISPDSGSHNTVVGLDGRQAYLAGLRSPLLTVTRTSDHSVLRQVGPFSNSIRPFTINGKQTRCYVNVNELLGFEIGDIESGKVLEHVEVQGFQKGKIKRHGCPSHGIGMTPDETEIWLCDGANQHLHIFDVTVSPARQRESIKLRDQPGWVTFTISGDFAYPSTGEVIDTGSRKIVARLRDEHGRMVQSEKLLEIDFQGSELVANGDQFGLGRQQ